VFALRGDPEVIARLQFFGICLAAVLIIDVLWELFHWWHDGSDDDT
jgi:hypothetical protein